MHIIWEALNCLLSVMLSVKCHFVNGLYIQTSLAVNCLPATSDRNYHTYAQKWWPGKLFIFSHPGGSVSLPGVRESGCISGRLPDDPGGFTCMNNSKVTGLTRPKFERLRSYAWSGYLQIWQRSGQEWTCWRGDIIFPLYCDNFFQCSRARIPFSPL